MDFTNLLLATTPINNQHQIAEIASAVIEAISHFHGRKSFPTPLNKALLLILHDIRWYYTATISRRVIEYYLLMSADERQEVLDRNPDIASQWPEEQLTESWNSLIPFLQPLIASDEFHCCVLKYYRQSRARNRDEEYKFMQSFDSDWTRCAAGITGFVCRLLSYFTSDKAFTHVYQLPNNPTTVYMDSPNAYFKLSARKHVPKEDPEFTPPKEPQFDLVEPGSH